MAELRLDGVTKQFGSETAVNDLSFTTDGELLVLLGPSGCGKSTTLRMIAGLESPTEGMIYLDSEDITNQPSGERSIAMVFQNYALYRTMTVEENMAYGLKHSTDLSTSEREQEVQEIAELFDIDELLDRDVDELSGGQKQRVALGRALVRDPDVFLLDEPLSSLDAKLRSEMRTELQQIQEELGVTTVYVTHDQKEAMTMGDRIAILNDGELQQIGEPDRTYKQPANQFVADFLGSPSINLFDVTLVDGGDEIVCRRNGRDITRLPFEEIDSTNNAVLGIRPEDLIYHSDPEQGDLDATVRVNEYQGNDSFLQLVVGDDRLTAVVPASSRIEAGDHVGMTLLPEYVHLFDTQTGEVIRTPDEDGADQTLVG